MSLRKAVIAWGVLSLCAGFCLIGCSQRNHEVTLAEAQSLAMQRLKKEQNFWCYDASKLPPLSMEEGPNQYVFDAEDPKQNIEISVFVLKSGEVGDSAVDLDIWNAWKDGKDVTLERTKTNCTNEPSS
ncbi:MAG: hypothetical protein ACREBW_01155 [Candidatus Micrarchaeaceae archaeon]